MTLALATSSPKLIPWFVSDVTPPDFRSTTKSLLSPSFFPQEATPEGAPATDSSEESRAHLYKMVKRWESYIDSGVFALSVPIDSPLGASDKKVGGSLLCQCSDQ